MIGGMIGPDGCAEGRASVPIPTGRMSFPSTCRLPTSVDTRGVALPARASKRPETSCRSADCCAVDAGHGRAGLHRRVRQLPKPSVEVHPAAAPERLHRSQSFGEARDEAVRLQAERGERPIAAAGADRDVETARLSWSSVLRFFARWAGTVGVGVQVGCEVGEVVTSVVLPPTVAVTTARCGSVPRETARKLEDSHGCSCTAGRTAT
jgi:hypothetical protein